MVMGVEAACVPFAFESPIPPPMHMMQDFHWSVLDRRALGTTEGVLLPSM